MKPGFLFEIEPRYFRLIGAARYSGLTVSMLRQLVNQPVNALPHIRVARQMILISRAALDTYLAERVHVGPEARQAGEPLETPLVKAFVDAMCDTGLGRSTAAGDLFRGYLRWAAGEPGREILTPRTFGMCLTALGFRRAKGAAGRRMWYGVALSIID